jgi:thymidine kinase
LNSPLVYCGPMWGGKTEGLISRLVRARIQNVHVKAFNPNVNQRTAVDEIKAHSGAAFPAIPVASGEEVLAKAYDAEVVGIDEVFMIPGIVDAVRTLVSLKKKIVIATLDMDSEGSVWESVGQILGMAQEVVKCPAVCATCKRDAYYTFRRPDAPNERILVGAANFYEPRCHSCWAAGQAEKKRRANQKKLFEWEPA